MLSRLELKQITAAVEGMTKYTNGDFMLQKSQLMKLLETFTEEVTAIEDPSNKTKITYKEKSLDKPKEFSRKTTVRNVGGIEDVYQANDDTDFEDDCDEDPRESEDFRF